MAYPVPVEGARLELPSLHPRSSSGKRDETVAARLHSVQRSGRLWRLTLTLADGVRVESVVVPMHSFHAKSWRTLCVSTQAGCRMGCAFCQTARMGLQRQLTAEEIVAQWHVAHRLLTEHGGDSDAGAARDRAELRNIVFMGMGEPLDNLDAVVEAIRVFTDRRGLRIPHCRITLSTVGLLSGVERLADLARREPDWRHVRLAVSLHAADDALRQTLVPPARAIRLAELKQALLAYPLPRRGRFLIQYVLLHEVNDSLADARALATWCADLPCVVNLIPYNPQSPPRFERPPGERVLRFLSELRARGVFAKQRAVHGDDVAAACGQLAVEPGRPILSKYRTAPPS